MKTIYAQMSFLMLSRLATALSMLIFFSLYSRAQSITLQNPNGGESWVYGSVETISWTGQSLGGVIYVEFSPNGGNTWYYFGEVPSAPNGGSAAVSVPYFVTANALLRLTDWANPAIKDVSDGPFNVSVPPINLYQPGTGSIVFVNTPFYVWWLVNDPDITLLNAEVSVDNGLSFAPLAQNINALSGFTYLVFPESPALSCILKLSNAADPTEFVLSSPFTVSPLPVYTITSPAGGEIVDVYSPLTISWNVEQPFSENCDLEFSTDNGLNWTTITNATSIGNSGSYVWTTPNVNSETCLIRIRDSYAISSVDVSGVFSIFPLPDTPLCMVTVDSLSNNNVIVWERPDTGLITNFLVYKETNQANVYEVIATVPYNGETVVTDNASNPAVRPYRYKIGFTDSENRVFPSGDFHQTIHLTISQGVGGNWNLIWTPYLGFDFASYNILRKTGSGGYQQIATLSSSFNSFTDFDAPSGTLSYVVAIERTGGCSVSAQKSNFSAVYSNPASLNPVSVSDSDALDFNVFPLPAKEMINIRLASATAAELQIILTDVTGNVLYNTTENTLQPGEQLSVSTRDWAAGMYVLQLIGDGVRHTQKIVIKP